MSHRTLSFGKVDYNGTGRRNCEVTIEIELRERKQGKELAISGNIWNTRGTDCYSCGQNLEEIAKLLPSNAKVQRIVEVWRRWHLNGMRAGTPVPTEILIEIESWTAA